MPTINLVTFNEIKFKRANQPENITVRTERQSSQIGSGNSVTDMEFAGINENYCCSSLPIEHEWNPKRKPAETNSTAA